MNERIRAREVRLIDPDGKQLGVKPLPEALAIARQMDLDLVEVAPDANPPVCRIMDYNRFKYETAQRAKESRKKATSTSIKEMKYRPKIGSGDFTTKTRQVSRFLEEGHKVKVTIMFRGREVSHPELGMKILDDLAEQVSSIAKVEAAPKLDGRNMVMVLAPDKRARQAARKTADLGQAASPGPTGPSSSSETDAGIAATAEPTTVEPTSPGPTSPGPTSTGPASTGPASTGPGSAEPGTPVPVAPVPVAPVPVASSGTVAASSSAARTGPDSTGTASAGATSTRTASTGRPAGDSTDDSARPQPSNGAVGPRREPTPRREPANAAAAAASPERS